VSLDHAIYGCPWSWKISKRKNAGRTVSLKKLRQRTKFPDTSGINIPRPSSTISPIAIITLCYHPLPTCPPIRQELLLSPSSTSFRLIPNNRKGAVGHLTQLTQSLGNISAAKAERFAANQATLWQSNAQDKIQNL